MPNNDNVISQPTTEQKVAMIQDNFDAIERRLNGMKAWMGEQNTHELFVKFVTIMGQVELLFKETRKMIEEVKKDV